MTKIFSISHLTEYQYTAPLLYLQQQLRYTVRSDIGQNVLNWSVQCHIDTDINSKENNTTNNLHNSNNLITKNLVKTTDSFDNTLLSLVLTDKTAFATKKVHCVVNGLVQVDTWQPQLQSAFPYFFLNQTELTALNSSQLAELKNSYNQQINSTEIKQLNDFVICANIIKEKIIYETGSTDVTTKAHESFSLQKGVCQDHAHIFIGWMRSMGIPTRYVGGYFYAGDHPEMASHAWVDVWLDNYWYSIDVTHGILTDDRYIRLAIGRDYADVAPVKGVRIGGGEEMMQTQVNINLVG